MIHAATQDIEAALTPFIDSGSVAGVVALAADRDDVLGEAALGYADIASGRKMQPDTLFWIASQTKPITATALMMLIDENRVHLDDLVNHYLPEFDDLWVAEEREEDHILLKRPNRPITLRDILAHTSGMAFASPMERPTLDMLALDVAVRGYAMTPLQSQPGAKYQYSNAGINTAARIIEIVTGIAYETFLQDRLLDPLGMEDTTFWPNADQMKRLAKAYRPNANRTALEQFEITQLQYPLDNPHRKAMPAGGLFSTAADVTKFCRMILNGGKVGSTRYITEDAIAQMSKKQTGSAVEENYGLGWGLGDGSFGHGGALSTGMTIYPRNGLITVFLVQHGGYLREGDNPQEAFVQRVMSV